MRVCGVRVGFGETAIDGWSVFGGTHGHGAGDGLIIGAGDGDSHGGGSTGGAGRAAVIGGGVLEGDDPRFPVGQVLEVGARVEGEGSVVVIHDGTFGRCGADVEGVRVCGVGVGFGETAIDG